ncbi:hypothetical protein ACIGB6_19240 [Paeniglutamicibacter gangotriensis]|uniref:hypothetical protein n=1 Tax=Paeniglutamicibacter gangotriensis TaxID=254787 RepID=UPI0037C955C3
MSSLPEESAPVDDRPKRLWAPWWVALILGCALGVTMTFLFAYKAFVIPGAIAMAAIIMLITVATIARRQKHAQALAPRLSPTYVLWMVLLVSLVGPVQVMLLPSNPQEIAIKALVMSAGLSLCIYGADRSLFGSFARPKGGLTASDA